MNTAFRSWVLSGCPVRGNRDPLGRLDQSRVVFYRCGQPHNASEIHLAGWTVRCTFYEGGLYKELEVFLSGCETMDTVL